MEKLDNELQFISFTFRILIYNNHLSLQKPSLMFLKLISQNVGLEVKRNIEITVVIVI